MDERKKRLAKKLVVPAVLAVAVLAGGCTGTPQPGPDAQLADAGQVTDAGCGPGYIQIDGTCEPLI